MRLLGHGYWFARAIRRHVYPMKWMSLGAVLILSVGVSRASAGSPWALVDQGELAGRVAENTAHLAEFQVWRLDREILSPILIAAPQEGGVAAAAGMVEFSLPLPDGTTQKFSVIESSIMEPALAAKFPQIKTYIVTGIDDPMSHGRIDLTPQGFHAILHTRAGRIFVDPLEHGGNGEFYASYFTRDAKPRDARFSCGTPQLPIVGEQSLGSVAVVTTSGDTLRNYRLACAATGEYTSFHGGPRFWDCRPL